MAECTTCELTKGFSKSCGDRTPGGNKTTVYLIPRCQIEAYLDIYEDNRIDGFTLKAGAGFYAVTANRDSVSFTQDAVTPTNFVNQQVVFTISQIAEAASASEGAQLAADFADSILAAGDTGIVVILTDKAGNRRLFGEVNGLLLEALQSVSGAAQTDISGITITLSNGESDTARTLRDDVVIPLASTP